METTEAMIAAFPVFHLDARVAPRGAASDDPALAMLPVFHLDARLLAREAATQRPDDGDPDLAALTLTAGIANVGYLPSATWRDALFACASVHAASAPRASPRWTTQLHLHIGATAARLARDEQHDALSTWVQLCARVARLHAALFMGDAARLSDTVSDCVAFCAARHTHEASTAQLWRTLAALMRHAGFGGTRRQVASRLAAERALSLREAMAQLAPQWRGATALAACPPQRVRVQKFNALC